MIYKEGIFGSIDLEEFGDANVRLVHRISAKILEATARKSRREFWAESGGPVLQGLSACRRWQP